MGLIVFSVVKPMVVRAGGLHHLLQHSYLSPYTVHPLCVVASPTASSIS